MEFSFAVTLLSESSSLETLDVLDTAEGGDAVGARGIEIRTRSDSEDGESSGMSERTTGTGGLMGKSKFR